MFTSNINFSLQEDSTQYFNNKCSDLQYLPSFSYLFPQLMQKQVEQQSILQQSQITNFENENQASYSLIEVKDSSFSSQQQIKQISKNTKKISKNQKKKITQKQANKVNKPIKNNQSKKEKEQGLENSFYCPFCSTNIQNQFRFSRYLHSHFKIHLKNLLKDKQYYINSNLDEYFTLQRIYSLLIKNWSKFKNQFSTKSQNYLKEVDKIEQHKSQKNVDALTFPISQLTQSIYSLFPLPLTNRIQIDVQNKTASFNFVDENEYQVNIKQQNCKLGFGINFDQNFVVVPLQGFQKIDKSAKIFQTPTNHIKFQIFASSYNDDIYFENTSKDTPCYFIMLDNQTNNKEPISLDEFKVFKAEKVYKMYPSDRFFYVIQIGKSCIDRYVITFSNLKKL